MDKSGRKNTIGKDTPVLGELIQVDVKHQNFLIFILCWLIGPIAHP